jgi:PleD family two-component response regulator
MDFQMPVMDGLEATKRFREFERSHYSKQPVDDDNASAAQRQLIIGLSATLDKEIIDDAMTCGLDDYLMKPIQKDSFLKKIEKIMAIRSQSSINQIPPRITNPNSHDDHNHLVQRLGHSHPLHSAERPSKVVMESSKDQKMEII